MNIEDNETFEALCARFLPKFNEFLMRRSKNIFSCELATSLDGINSMPALYDKDGVRKQVIAPLTLLTKNIDEEIREVTEATATANNAAEKAEEAARQVTSAIDSTKQLVDTVTAAETTRDESENTRIANEKTRIAQEDTRQEQEDVRIANEENRNTGEAERQRAEVARAEAEQLRATAEEKRVLDYATVKAAADKATENANSMAANPPYVDRDGYYYRWNVGTQSYDKTDVNLTGKAFVIKKVFTSIAEMTATDINTFNENDFILINTANTEDEDNAKLYVVAVDENGDKFYSYLVDLSGFRGFTGKTPQITVGNVETLDSQSDVSVSMSADGVDSDGNPRYKLNFGIPKGDHFTFADLTEAEKNELMQPAVEAAEAANSQTLLCQTATNEANDASEKSKEQTTLCQTATNEANEVLKKISDSESGYHKLVGRHIFAINGTAPFNYIYLCRIGNSSSYSTIDVEIDLRTRYQSAKLEIRISTGSVAYGTSSISIVKKVLSDRHCNLWYVQTKNSSGYDYYDIYCECGAWNNGSFDIINKGYFGRVEFEAKNTPLNNLPSGATSVINFDDRIWHPLFIVPNGDDVLRIYGNGSSGNDERILIQTQIDGRTDDYDVANYGGDARHRLCFQCRGGRVGIGTSSPGYKLDVTGDTRVGTWIRTTGKGGWLNETYGGGTYMEDGTWVRIYGGKSFYCSQTVKAHYIESESDIVAYVSSDARLKTNIHKDDYLKCIESLGGIYAFTYKKNNKDSIGLIAQNLLNTTFADIVSKDDDGYYKVNYWSPKLISLALGGVEQLSDEVKELRSQVAELKAMIKTLKKNKL